MPKCFSPKFTSYLQASYKKQIQSQLHEVCNEIISLLTDYLIPDNKGDDKDSKVSIP
jgi:hypothetical protein